MSKLWYLLGITLVIVIIIISPKIAQFMSRKQSIEGGACYCTGAILPGMKPGSTCDCFPPKTSN